MNKMTNFYATTAERKWVNSNNTTYNGYWFAILHAEEVRNLPSRINILEAYEADQINWEEFKNLRDFLSEKWSELAQQNKI